MVKLEAYLLLLARMRCASSRQPRILSIGLTCMPQRYLGLERRRARADHVSHALASISDASCEFVLRLCLWQTHLSELAAEQKDAEKLRQEMLEDKVYMCGYLRHGTHPHPHAHAHIHVNCICSSRIFTCSSIVCQVDTAVSLV